MTADELERLLAEDAVTVLDVRSAEEYTGEGGYPCDPRQGHIPGALNVEWSELFAGEGRPHDAETIRRLLAERGADASRSLVTYCHSGQRSEYAATALRAAGLEVENYVGSWHEWSRREAPGV